MPASKREKALLLCLIIFSIIGFFTVHGALLRAREEKIFAEEQILRYQQSFGSMALSAKSAYVYDSTDKSVIYEYNPDLPRPIASITKTLTTLVALRTLGPDGIVPITAESLEPDAPNGLRLGEHFHALDLAQFMLVESSNDAAQALALASDKVLSGRASNDGVRSFLQAMTDTAKRLGLTTMVSAGIGSVHGLDAGADNTPTVISTAREIATLVDVVSHADEQATESTRMPSVTVHSIEGTTHTAINTDGDVTQIPGILFSKTGYTDSAGGNLAVIYRAENNHDIIVVVLGSTRENRFSDVLSLVGRANTYLDFHPPVLEGVGGGMQ